MKRKPATRVNGWRANESPRKETTMNITRTNKRRRYAAFAAIPVALLALTACEGDMTPRGESTSTVSTPVAPVVESATPTMSDAELSEIAMEAVLAQEGIFTPSGFAKEYAAIVCQGFEDGLSPIQVIVIGAEEIPAYSSQEHAFMVGASTGAFCPEFMSQVGASA